MLKIITGAQKFLCLFVAVFCFLGLAACQKKEFRDDTIYLFWQPGCSHCHHAIDYFKNKKPMVKVDMIDISKQEGYQKLLKAVTKFNLGDKIMTPLFIVKGKTLIGWSNEMVDYFDEVAPQFQE